MYYPGKGRPNYQVIASATTIEPAFWAKVASITGTTPIQTINTVQVEPGHTVTLVFAGACTIDTSAGNVKLDGDVDYTSAAGDTLTLVTDGATWYEVGSYQAP